MGASALVLTPNVGDTVKEAVTSAAGRKFSLPGWLAAKTTVPAPVIVTTVLSIVAGPLFTLNTTGNALVAAGTATVTVLPGA